MKSRLSLEDRLTIETMLKSGKSVYEIANVLSRPVTTITREIKARAVESNKSAPLRLKNRCVFHMQCEKQHVCAHCLYDGDRKCRLCRQCNSHCPAFVERKCERLNKPPYVCNGCPDEPKCVLRKRYYLYDEAQKNYKTGLSESRTGVNITEEELQAFDAVLHELTMKGQSVHAAIVSNPDKFSVSEKSVYRYINGGLLTTTRGHLPRACKLKPRKRKSVEFRVDKTCRINRTWDDYLKFVETNPGMRVVEMDTVEGVKGGKVLLTMIFNPFNFMLAFLINAKTSECVLGVFAAITDALKERYGNGWRKMFTRLFPIILTDNGSEFTNPSAIESDDEGQRTFVFYCKPYASYQKPHIERNHEYIRRVLPKGNAYTETTSFNNLTQDKVTLMMSHINSYVREGLDNTTPYNLFTSEFGEEVAELFGIVRIAANDVTLKPSLLGIEVKIKEGISLTEKETLNK